MVDAKITKTPDGVQLSLFPPDREPVAWTLHLDSATKFWWDWWAAISAHYPDVSIEPADSELPAIMETGDFRMKCAARSNGLVRLSLQPRDLVGFGFEFQPGEARELARQLLHMADQVEAFQSPN